jgi:hypothetical protein
MAGKPQIHRSEMISISVVTPRMGIRSFFVSKSMTIRNLATQCHISETGLIFNGEFLDPKLTLEFYNLQNNDAIVAIPPNERQGTIDHWKRVTRDSENFMESVQFAVRKESRVGFLRLRDLRAAKMECRPRAFRRFLANQKPLENGHPLEFPTVIAEAPTEIPSSPLPVSW